MNSSNVIELQQKWNREPFIQISLGESQLPKITLSHPKGSRLEVYLYGAHITSFKTSKGEELLFMSSKAIFKETKAIRGGIPVIFPQFGPGELPQHGFARVSHWLITETKVNSDSVSVTLTLNDSEETRKLWPNAFSLEYTVILQDDDKLSMQLKITNKNPTKSFSFTNALHTYFKVQDIHKVTVLGLAGLMYIDKTQKGEKFQENNEEISIVGETDRVYLSTPDVVKIGQGSGTILLQKEGFPDCVIWNPWIQKAKEMVDFGDEDWREMICAEVGQIGTPSNVSAGSSWIGKQILSKL